MQRVLALTLVLLAVAFGQSRTTVNYLNSTGTTLGAITNIVGDPNAMAPVIYAYLVPENAGLLQITLENLNNDDCYYLDYYIISDVLPCYEDTFGLGDADRSFCNFYTSSYSGSYPVTFEAQPGQGSSYFKYQTNKYVYIGVGTESTYSGSVCSYSLTVNLNNTCATGSVAAYTGDDLPVCQPVTIATISNFTSSVTGANSTDFTKLWEFDVPVGTAYVSFTVAATEYFYIYGSQNAATSGYSTYDCYDSANSNSGTYYTTLTCYTPESGKFYALFELTSSPNDDTFNYNITSAIKVCPDNMLGENCEFPAQALNISNLQTVNVVIPYNSSVDTYAFLYFDIPAGNTWTDNIQLNYYLNNVTNNEGIYSQVTKNTIAVEDVERYSTQEQYIYRGETDYWVFSWQDWAVPSRIYIGFQCYTASTGGNCNVTVSFNTSVITTGTTGTATTGTATTVSTGTATTVSTGTATTVSTGTATTVSTGTATTVSTGTSTTSGNVTITTSSASAVVATAALVLIAALF